MPPPLLVLLDGELPLARTVLGLLSQRDVQVIVAHAETADPELMRHMAPCAGTHAHADPRDPTADFGWQLIEWLDRERPDVVLPLSLATTTLISRHRDALAEAGTVAPIPCQEHVDLASDRSALWSRAQRVGISIPQVARPSLGARVDELLGTFARTPALVPRELGRPEGAMRADGPEAAKRFHRELERRTGTPPLLVEPIPAEAGWLAVTALCDSPGGVMARLGEAWTGWDSEAGQPRWRSVAEHRGATEATLRLLGALEWTGPATAQFALDPREGTARLLQLWPGLGGGVALAAAAGLDLVWPLVEWALGHAPTHPAPYRTDLFAAWQPDGVPWLFAPRDDGIPGAIQLQPDGEEVAVE